MKKHPHLPALVFAVLLTAGVALALLWPSSPQPLSPPGKTLPPPAEASLLLDSRPAIPGDQAGRSEFDFGETIYATVALSAVEAGDHTLVFRWINPRGGVQETFRKEFHSPGGSYRSWSWLELRGEEFLPLPLGPLGPARFLGPWSIEVDLDASPLTRSAFTIR